MFSYKAVRTLKDVHQQRDEIMALAWQYRARQVFVFGSLMRGGLQSESDIDFLVEFEEGYKLRDHIRRLSITQRGGGVGITGLRLHVLRGSFVFQHQSNMRPLQIMGGDMPDTRSLHSNFLHPSDSAGAHGLVRSELKIASGCHRRVNVRISAAGRISQRIKRSVA